MTPSEDESLKMSGGQALFSLGNAVLLMMAGVRASLEEQTLVDSQVTRLYHVYAALATCSKELTQLAVEIDTP